MFPPAATDRQDCWWHPKKLSHKLKITPDFNERIKGQLCWNHGRTSRTGCYGPDRPMQNTEFWHVILQEKQYLYDVLGEMLEMLKSNYHTEYRLNLVDCTNQCGRQHYITELFIPPMTRYTLMSTRAIRWVRTTSPSRNCLLTRWGGMFSRRPMGTRMSSMSKSLSAVTDDRGQRHDRITSKCLCNTTYRSLMLPSEQS